HATSFPYTTLFRSPHVHRLISSGVIRIAAIKSGGHSAIRCATGIDIALAGRSEPVRKFIMESESIEFAARAHRAHDFAATTVAPSSAEVLAIIEESHAPSTTSPRWRHGRISASPRRSKPERWGGWHNLYL